MKNRNRTLWLRKVIAGASCTLALGLVGCGDDDGTDPPGGSDAADAADAADGNDGADATDGNDGTDGADGGTFGSMSGRLEEADGDGNQHVAPGLVAEVADGGDAQVVEGNRVAEVQSIDESGKAETKASGSVDASGSYTVEEVPTSSSDHAWIVQVTQGTQLVGRAIVTKNADGELVAAPISGETTAEADAYVEMIANGHAADEIDVAGLESRITAEMAASVESGSELAAGAWAAQTASLAVMGSGAARAVTAEEMAQATASAHADLVVLLNAATTTEAENAAWAAYGQSAHTAISTSLGVTTSVQSAASAAANAAFQMKLEGSGAAASEKAAGAWLTAKLDAMVVTDAFLDAAKQAKAEAGFEAFFKSVTEAKSEADINAALEDLGASVVLTLAGDLLLETDKEEELKAFFKTAGDARAKLETDLEAATDGQAVGQAYLSYLGSIDAAAKTAGEASVDASAVAEITALAHIGGGSLLLDIGGSIDLAIDLVIQISATGQKGAAGLAADIQSKLSTATTASFGSVGSNGSITALASGSLEPANVVHFEEASLNEGELGIVTLLDAKGDIVGAAFVNPDDLADGQSAGLISTEGTAEALVQLSAMAKGQDLNGVVAAELITEATAKAALADGDIDALTQGVLAAQTSLFASFDLSESTDFQAATAKAWADYEAAIESAQDANDWMTAQIDLDAAFWAAVTAGTTTSNEQMADAAAKVGAAFSSAVALTAKADGNLSAIVSAEAKANAAMASSAALSDELGSAPEIKAAVAAYLDAVAAVDSTAGVDAAGKLLAEVIVVAESDADGTLEAALLVGVPAATAAATEAAVEAALTAALAHATTFNASAHTAAVVGATGWVDFKGLSDGVNNAHASLRTAISTTLSAQLGLVLTAGAIETATNVSVLAAASLVTSSD